VRVRDSGVQEHPCNPAREDVLFCWQGACKFGFYEHFKNQAVDLLGLETVKMHTLSVYLGAGALAELIASFMLCPWEAVRIRMVSKPDFAPNMVAAFRHMLAVEGLGGMYRGLPPIVFKQVPYTMTQFASFQYALDGLYDRVLRKKKAQMSHEQQLVVSTVAGVAAGVVSAVCSHPADTVLSRINMARKRDAAVPSIRSVINEIGFGGLWKGIGLRCAMVGTISGGMFLIYDSVKVLTGLPTTGTIGSQ
jgi:solute carrier family 25 phosphate transporter 3